MPIDTTYLDADSDNIMLARPALLATTQAVNNLALSSGAALVGANAYQTQDDVNLQWASVKRFGAVGNGTTDDTSAFVAALASGLLNIYVPPVAVGYVIDPNALTMVDGQHLFGAGFKSCLILKAATVGTLLKTGDNAVQISNIRLFGGDDSGKTTVAASASDRSGLGANYNKATVLTNVIVHGFGNKGIYQLNIATQRSGTLHMMGGRVYNCWMGVEAGPDFAEYTRWTSVSIGGCRIGFKCSSGNVFNINPMYSDNGYNFYLDGVGIANDAHGGVVGGQLNHANIENIYAESVDFGHVFSGVAIFAGSVHLKNCKGINISGGVIDVAQWKFEGGGRNYIRGNTSPNNYSNVTYHSYNGSLDDTVFEDNHGLTGELIYSNAIKFAGLSRYQAGVDEKFLMWGDGGLNRSYGFQWSYLGGGGKLKFSAVNNYVVATTPSMTWSRVTGKLEGMMTNLVVAANDAAAATAGIPVGGMYRNGSVVMVRVA